MMLLHCLDTSFGRKSLEKVLKKKKKVRNQPSPSHHEAVKLFQKTTENVGDMLYIQYSWKKKKKNKKEKENRKI